MRKDLRQLHVAWREAKLRGPGTARAHTVTTSDGSVLAEDVVEGWLQHVRLVWKMARDIVELLERGSSVMCHCSDGWDRTAQVVALAQLALDPHCRTLRGFGTLIQKEWCAFGHKFAERHGHDAHIADAQHEQRAPIFLQFLDAVYQLVSQQPSYFEFTPALLLSLADHSHACLFGTFLVNSPSESAELNLPATTQSFWSFVLGHESAFLNAAYEARAETLLPKAEEFQLWSDYHIRWYVAAKPPPLDYLLPAGAPRQVFIPVASTLAPASAPAVLLKPIPPPAKADGNGAGSQKKDKKNKKEKQKKSDRKVPPSSNLAVEPADNKKSADK